MVLISLALVVGVGLVPCSHGKDYPTKPIEMLISWGPGAASDLVGRLIAEVAKKHLGQPVLVINKPGAGGTVAVSELIKAKPDGYKIIYLSNNYPGTTVKTQKIPFNISHIVPLMNFVEMKQGFVLRADSPWKTFGELLDYAKRNPGKLSWSHTGRGIGPHLNGLLIFRRAGVETVDVPYSSSPDQVVSLLGGHTEAAIVPLGVVRDHIRAGKIRFVLNVSNRRYSDFPEVPCPPDLGFPDQIASYMGVWVHKDTPEDVKEILLAAFKKTYDDPEFRKGMANFGEELRFGGSEFLKEETGKLERIGVPLLKELGLYAGQ